MFWSLKFSFKAYFPLEQQHQAPLDSCSRESRGGRGRLQCHEIHFWAAFPVGPAETAVSMRASHSPALLFSPQAELLFPQTVFPFLRTAATFTVRRKNLSDDLWSWLRVEQRDFLSHYERDCPRRHRPGGTSPGDRPGTDVRPGRGRRFGGFQ